jgi:diguanylate cyclase (GGDEF)-like protein
MPDATLEVALATLERLRTLTFGIHLPSSGAGLRVSLSAGVTIYDRVVRSLDELIARADSALYVAKNEGRDLVRVAAENFQSSSSGIRRLTRG